MLNDQEIEICDEEKLVSEFEVKFKALCQEHQEELSALIGSIDMATAKLVELSEKTGIPVSVGNEEYYPKSFTNMVDALAPDSRFDLKDEYMGIIAYACNISYYCNDYFDPMSGDGGWQNSSNSC